MAVKAIPEGLLYRAAAGETVEIKGSEIITGWKKDKGGYGSNIQTHFSESIILTRIQYMATGFRTMAGSIIPEKYFERKVAA